MTGKFGTSNWQLPLMPRPGIRDTNEADLQAFILWSETFYLICPRSSLRFLETLSL
jgi:hypothetical protein